MATAQPCTQPPATNSSGARGQTRREQTALFPANYFPPPYDPANDKHFNVDDTNFWLGKRRAGKTTGCAQWNLVRRRFYPLVFCFSKTARNNFWHQYLPDNKIAHDVDEDVCDELLKVNYKRLEAWKKLKVKSGRYIGNPIVKVIFEDCITENQLRNSSAMKTICLNGRHHGISCDVLAQDFIGLTPGERENFDRWIIFRPDDDRTRAMIRASFGDEIMAIAERVWAKNLALVVNKKTRVPPLAFSNLGGRHGLFGEGTHKNLVLGNQDMWKGIKIETQKKEHPCVDLPSLATLAGRFNEKIKDEEVPLDGTDMAEKGNDTGEEPETKVTEPDASWWSMFKGDDVIEW